MAKGRGTSTGRASAISSGAGGQTVDIICSECYMELSYNPAIEGEAIVCPACEHSCDRPDEAQVHRIADLAAKERSSFLVSFIVLLVSLLGMFSWIAFTQNPTVNAEGDAASFYGPLAIGGLGFLAVLILGAKHDSSRWEAYF